MTGGLVLIYRGSMLQICVAIFICSVALPVVARFKPYAILKDDKFKIDNSALAEAFQVGCRVGGEVGKDKVFESREWLILLTFDSSQLRLSSL